MVGAHAMCAISGKRSWKHCKIYESQLVVTWKRSPSDVCTGNWGMSL